MREFTGYLRGVDLGGWYSQCPHTEDRYDNFIKEEDFKIIAGWGLDHVRLPFDYELLETKDGQRIEKGYDRIQTALDWAGKYGINVILDLHKTYGYSFDAGEKEAGFFDNAAYQERFYKLWEDVITRFGKYHDRIAVELLNEVTDESLKDKWNAIASECIRRIRAIDSQIDILVGGYWNNSVDAVKDIEVPFDDHIVLNFHCYDPFIFTHQAAYWVDYMPLDFRTDIAGKTYEELKAITATVAPHFADQFNIMPDMKAVFGHEYFEARWASAIKIAEEKNAPLYCGEYGAIEHAKDEELVHWYQAIHQAFEKHHIGRAAWSYREMNFGIIDDHRAAVRDEIVKNL